MESIGSVVFVFFYIIYRNSKNFFSSCVELFYGTNFVFVRYVFVIQSYIQLQIQKNNRQNFIGIMKYLNRLIRFQEEKNFGKSGHFSVFIELEGVFQSQVILSFVVTFFQLISQVDFMELNFTIDGKSLSLINIFSIIFFTLPQYFSHVFSFSDVLYCYFFWFLIQLEWLKEQIDVISKLRVCIQQKQIIVEYKYRLIRKFCVKNIKNFDID
eukprot:TRINITY_DN11115_c0_g1_i1.p1 TRINITY_DN11115_c0_g1~~TRINITY_DN11115_c0_g1_i1.p1  ORF type:complete len:212 (+),score=10.91 TRINITY_DN11115_c0_g1_i1:65-700(+)